MHVKRLIIVELLMYCTLHSQKEKTRWSDKSWEAICRTVLPVISVRSVTPATSIMSITSATYVMSVTPATSVMSVAVEDFIDVGNVLYISYDRL